MGYIKQYHDIKFPLSRGNDSGFFLDLNYDSVDRLESDLAHVILTPKGSKLRHPDFGTDLIKHIFGMNDEEGWGAMLDEARKCIDKYVPNAKLVNIEILESENDHEKMVKLSYSVRKGEVTENRVTLLRI